MAAQRHAAYGSPNGKCLRWVPSTRNLRRRTQRGGRGGSGGSSIGTGASAGAGGGAGEDAHAGNLKLVRAVLVAGLYPQVWGWVNNFR